ncbi:ankyrin repeat domain-containing protein [Singulisphaera rosea]
MSRPEINRADYRCMVCKDISNGICGLACFVLGKATISEWFVAAIRGDTRTLARLLEDGTDVDSPGEYGWTALMVAVYGRDMETLQWLLDRGADPNRESNQNSAMTHAALWARGWVVESGRCRIKREPDARFLERLMSAGGRLGLREAILLGDVEMAQRIIDDDASIDINGESNFGMHDTFLMLAAHVGPVEMADMLLDRGAEIGGTDDIGATALMLASEMGRVEIVTRLLDRGASINTGWPTDTALYRANRGGHTEVVASLLARGAKWGKPWDVYS